MSKKLNLVFLVMFSQQKGCDMIKKHCVGAG